MSNVNNELHKNLIHCFRGALGPAAVSGVFLLHCALFLFLPLDGGANFALRHLPLDDAWIHLAYAKNLLAHGYFLYNPGEIETGATSPLWVMVLAAVLAVARAPVLAARLAGLAAGAACAALGFVELRRAGGRVAAWTGTAMLVLDPMWITGCLSGMEIPLTGLLLIALIRQLRLERPWRAGLVMGLAVLARPEMVLPAAAAGALLLWILARRAPLKNPWTAALPGGTCCAVAALAVALPWFIYCRLGTGHWLPNTFYAKRTGEWHVGWDMLRTLYHMLEHYYWPSPLVHDPVCLGLLGLGAAFVLFRMRDQPATAGWLLFPLVHLAGWSLINGSGDNGAHPGEYLTFAFTRYYLPDYPLMFGVAGLGAGVAGGAIAWLGSCLRTELAPAADRLVRRGLAAVLIALLVMGNLFGWWTFTGSLWRLGDGYLKVWRYQAHYNALSCRNIYEIHERMGQWVDQNVPAGAVVAAQDAGAIRYFARQRIIDLWGLNSHDYLFAPDKAAYLRRAGVTVAVVFAQGRLDPLFDFKTRRVLAHFSTVPNLISEESTMDVREVQ